MDTKRMLVTMVGGAALWMPVTAWGQVDPNAGSGASLYPASSTGMNQPAGTGMNQPGSQPGMPGTPNQPSSMRDSLGAPGATGQEMLDKQFVRTAAEGSIADIKLSTLAVEKGSPAVKELAQKLVDDHMAMNKEMGSVADAMGVMLPRKIGKDQQREFDKLSGLSGKDFDTEYLTYMVTAHYTDLHNFHMEASTAQNQELAAEVVKGIGMMHAHLGLISSTAKEEGIVLPPRPQRPVATTASK